MHAGRGQLTGLATHTRVLRDRTAVVDEVVVGVHVQLALVTFVAALTGAGAATLCWTCEARSTGPSPTGPTAVIPQQDNPKGSNPLCY